MSAVSNDILVIIAILASGFASLRFMHMLQLESYQMKMYIKWVKRNTLRDWVPIALIFAICCLLDAALPFGKQALGSALPDNVFALAQHSIRIIYIILMVYIAKNWSSGAKKPLVYTGRIKRLCFTVLLIIALLNLYPYFLDINVETIAVYITARIGAYLPALLLPLIVLLAAVINYPIEEANKRRYFLDARYRLGKRTDLIKIGITGSFGKTSTKFTLGAILSQKYDTLVSPSSFNTPMGLTRVIREMLEPKHQIFVAEMGARYVGDIEELCDLVSPTIAMLTSVGAQHLETFGNYENIKNTKYELIASLPADGAAFFNADDPVCKELYLRKATARDKFLYGVQSSDNLYMRAEDLHPTSTGSEFTLINADGAQVRCKTELLGRHNILNIVGCAAVAHYLGLSMNQIAGGISRIMPVEHRLQLIKGQITVIDDAFNSNPQGARMALEVLASFPQKRIVITPGMVELGKDEAKLNEELGKDIACSADVVILVGKKRTEPIMRGLQELEFLQDNIYVVDTLAEATALLGIVGAVGDTVLFENDLPDNFAL